MSVWRAKSRPSARFMFVLRGARRRVTEALAGAFEAAGGAHPKAMGEQKQERQHSCHSRLLPLPGAAARGRRVSARGRAVRRPTP